MALYGWQIFNGKAIICYRTISSMASMKKDFIVARIEAAQDGGLMSTSVSVTLMITRQINQ